MPGRQFSTHANNPETIDALHDGIPAWMQRSIDDWISVQIARGSGYSSSLLPNVDSIRRLERLLRVSLIGTNEITRMHSSLFGRLNPDENLKLDVIDGVLQALDIPTQQVIELEEILEESGSKWKVVDSGEEEYQLEERVAASVVEAMENLAEQNGDTTDYMKKAWGDAFGRNPNPSAAYSNTIKAIEAASWQTVTPSNSRATLGTIIRELTDHPENFHVAISERAANRGIEAIRRDMAFIWEGQTDRHGTSNPVLPTQESAEQAIMIGLSLCQQFTRNLVSNT